MTDPAAATDRPGRETTARGKAVRLIAAILLIEAAGVAAWRAFDGWRIGRVLLTNVGPPLTVQVLDESGEAPIGGVTDLVTETTLTLPDGDYRLRVNGLGRLGQTYRLAVHRGETIAHELALEPAPDRGKAIAKRLSLDENRLLAGERPAPPVGGKTPRFDPGFGPAHSADLDGDGAPESMAIGPGPTKDQQTVAALSASGRAIWTATINVPFLLSPLPPPIEWPWLFDLDGDSRSEVAVPDSGPLPPAGGYRGLRLLDGATGQTRWVHPMSPKRTEEDPVTHLDVAPDLDGDGVRDLVSVSLFAGRPPSPLDPDDSFGSGRVFVDALSGRDGRPLWTWSRYFPRGLYVFTWPVRWWGRGPDGWPLLVVPIGGGAPPEWPRNFAPSPVLSPIVHILEASTGKERHTISGLYRPDVLDLDDDGLDDLWGTAEGQLRAFHGEEPEAWRALGQFEPTAEIRTSPGGFFFRDIEDRGRAVASRDFERSHPVGDLDGDGIGDVLIARVVPPDESLHRRTGTRTAVARSGRDGRRIWTAVLDPPRIRDEPDGEIGLPYELTTLPLPSGDLDGDGTPDVLVTRTIWLGGIRDFRPPASLPFQVLSGRTGRRLWSSGTLPLGSLPDRGARMEHTGMPIFLRIEPDRTPDVVLRYRTPHVWPGVPQPQAPRMFPGQARMARLSGRDGSVVWDTALTEDRAPTAGSGVLVPSLNTSITQVGDLNGDGSLDAVIIDSPAAWGSLSSGDANRDVTLKAISLKDGQPHWSRGFPISFIGRHQLLLAVGDLDGDRRAEVLVAHADRGAASRRAVVALDVLDGPDGRTLWSWRGGDRYHMDFWELVMARVDGGRRLAPCVAMGDSDGWRRLIRLDAHGGETWNRELPSDDITAMEPADLDGDGNDEFMIATTTGPQVLGSDGMPSRSGRPTKAPDGLWYLAAAPDRPDAVLPAPAIGLTGPGGSERPRLLDPGDAARRPLRMVSTDNATVCRYALPILGNGRYAPSRGTAARPDPARRDPRWARPWPWIEPTLQTIALDGWVVVLGLALVNAVVPIAILRLAARRRPWGLRLLMALPVAAAIPLAAYQSRDAWLPARIGTLTPSTRLLFFLGTLAGLPIVIYGGAAVLCLFRRGWRPRMILPGLTILASAIVGAGWLWWDTRRMPAIEHYDRSGAFLVVLPGMYASGVALLIAWPFRPILRRIRRARGRTPRPPIDDGRARTTMETA